MNLTVQSIKVRDYAWKNYSAYEINKTTKDILMYDEGEYTSVIKEISKLKGKTLSPSDKVYFTQYSQFPRYKFRETYENKIVRKMEKADAIVVNKDLISPKKYVYTRTYYELSDGSYTLLNGISNNYYQIVLPTGISYTGNIKTFLEGIDEEFVNFINNVDEKKIILDSDFLKGINKDCAQLDDDNLESVRDLLKSRNKDDVKMAMNMLSTLDYEKYGYRIAYLLANCQHNIRQSGYVPNTLTRYLMDKLNKEFSWTNYNDLRFCDTLLKSNNEEKIEFSKKIIQNHIKDNINNTTFDIIVELKKK